MPSKKHPDSIAQLRQRLDRARTPERRMAAQLALGPELRDSDPAEAQRLLEGVFSQTSPENHPAFHSRAAVNLRPFCFARGEKDKHRNLAEVALQAAQSAGSRRGQSLAQAELGLYYVSQGQYDEACCCLEQSSSLARSIGYQRAAGLTLRGFGIMAERRGDAKQALAFYQEMLCLDEHVGDHASRSRSLWCVSNAYAMLGETDSQAEYLYRTIESCEVYGPEKVRFLALDSLSDIYDLRGDVSRARQLRLDVIESAEAQGLRMVMLMALMNEGLSQLEEGSISAARNCLERALTCCSNALLDPYRPMVHAAMARLCLAERNPEDALEWLDRGERGSCRRTEVRAGSTGSRACPMLRQPGARRRGPALLRARREVLLRDGRHLRLGRTASRLGRQACPVRQAGSRPVTTGTGHG